MSKNSQDKKKAANKGVTTAVTTKEGQVKDNRADEDCSGVNPSPSSSQAPACASSDLTKRYRRLLELADKLADGFEADIVGMKPSSKANAMEKLIRTASLLHEVDSQSRGEKQSDIVVNLSWQKEPEKGD